MVRYSKCSIPYSIPLQSAAADVLRSHAPLRLDTDRVQPPTQHPPAIQPSGFTCARPHLQTSHSPCHTTQRSIELLSRRTLFKIRQISQNHARTFNGRAVRARQPVLRPSILPRRPRSETEPPNGSQSAGEDTGGMSGVRALCTIPSVGLVNSPRRCRSTDNSPAIHTATARSSYRSNDQRSNVVRSSLRWWRR